MSSDDISIPSMLSMKELSILNVYQISILQYLLFMFKVKNSVNSRVFSHVFLLKDHLYPTKFSDNSFKKCDFNLNITRFAVAFRGPTMWNKFLTESEKCCSMMYLKT